MHFLDALLYVGMAFSPVALAFPMPEQAVNDSTTSSVASDGLSSDNLSNGTLSTEIEGTKAYSYSNLPAGITLVTNNQSVDFLQNTTGSPTLQARQPDDITPPDAAWYNITGSTIDLADFRVWHDAVKGNNTGSSKTWIKVHPGTYAFSKGKLWDNNLAFNGFTGWTLDLRNVTFVETRIDNDPSYADQMLYINNSDDFTILGGTFWLNQGMELFSQATVISLDPAPVEHDPSRQNAILQVDEGYNHTIWADDHAAGSFGCINTANPAHYYRPACNFHYQYDIALLPHNQVSASYSSRSGVAVGQTLTVRTSISSAASASLECNGNVHFRGMTSNAVYYNYGVGPTCTKKPLTLEDCLITNLPAFKGRKERVTGPTVAGDNLGSAISQDGRLPAIDVRGSWWQYSGAPGDLTGLEGFGLPEEAARAE